MTPLTETSTLSSAAGRRPMARQPVLWAWAISLGLHIALFGWLGCTVSIEKPLAGIETGDQCPTLVILDSSGLGNELELRPSEPSLQSLEVSKISAPPVPVIEPPLPVMSPEPPPTVTKATIEETPQHPTETPTASTAKDDPAPSTSKIASRAPRLESAKVSQQPVGSLNTHGSGKSGGQCMRLGTEGAPSVLHNPPPEYPLAERQAGHEGTVILLIRVEPDGAPSKVLIATSSGFPLLDASARNTVRRRWRFIAARQSGTAIAAEFLLPIRFTLKEYRRLTLL